MKGPSRPQTRKERKKREIEREWEKEREITFYMLPSKIGSLPHRFIRTNKWGTVCE
jgi:hypothetical protein